MGTSYRYAQVQKSNWRQRLVIPLIIVTIITFGLIILRVVTNNKSSTNRPTLSANTQAQATTPAVNITATQASFALPIALSREAAFSDGKNIYVAGGLTSADTTPKTIIEIDPATGGNTTAGSLITGAHDAGYVTYGDSTYIIGGGNSTELSTVQAIAGAGVGSKLSVSTSGKLPTTLSDSVAVNAYNSIFVAGGYDGTKPVATVLKSTDGKTFTTFATLPVGVRYPAVAVVGNEMWVMGGQTATTSDSNLMQVVDLGTGAVTKRTLSLNITDSVAFVKNGTAYLVGGRTSNRVRDDVITVDKNGVAKTVAQLPYAIANTALAEIDSHVYALGGESTAHTTNVIDINFSS